MKILKFYADWCQPCKQMDSIMRGMEYTPIDVETNEGNSLARHYNVQGLPTLVVTDDSGHRLDSRTGLQSRETINDWLEDLAFLEAAHA